MNASPKMLNGSTAQRLNGSTAQRLNGSKSRASASNSESQARKTGASGCKKFLPCVRRGHQVPQGPGREHDACSPLPGAPVAARTAHFYSRRSQPGRRQFIFAPRRSCRERDQRFLLPEHRAAASAGSFCSREVRSRPRHGRLASPEAGFTRSRNFLLPRCAV